MASDTNSASFVEILDHWSVRSPDREACRFLSFGSAPERTVSYHQLVTQARAVAAALQAHVQRGDRVILLYPPGLDFVIAFLAAFHAGAIAVPVYPPDPARPGRDLVKLRAIIADAQPALILSTVAIRRLVAAAGQDAGDLVARPWLDTDAVDLATASDWCDPGLGRGDIAFLQYTSGSTGQPKGVMVSHGNLLHNLRCIQRVFEDDASSTLVSWLPLYHDMGLIGNLLHGLYIGTTSLLMSPLDFLEQPLRWLDAISRHRAHTSGGPNFAYELCVRKIAPEQRHTLDLGSWRVAFNGAEPIRPATIERFSEAFEPHGFRREAFFPCYGLAEATLIVSGSDKALAPRFEQLDARALEREPRLVGCGRVVPDHRIEIVDPVRLSRCAPDEIGEIWVAGPSVAQGYWGKPELSAETFGATLRDGDDQRFLRTGDLGFVRHGELFVAGRLKDLIIVRGRNHYPQDIELTAERAHPALRPGCGAAFAIDGEITERLVLVFEIDRRLRDTPIEEIATAVSRHVAEHHDVELHELVLIETGRIPKTTSGKIQRSLCRRGYRDGKLPVVAAWQRPPVAAPASAPGDELVIGFFRELLGAHDVQASDDFFALGGHSLMAMRLVSRIHDAFGVQLPVSALFEAPTPGALASHVAAALRDGQTAAPPLRAAPHGGTAPMSFAQQRLWFLDRLGPGETLYNMTGAYRLRGALDRMALERALTVLVARHEVLRTRLTASAGEPVQIIDPPAPHRLTRIDLRPALPDEREAQLVALAEREVATPFDLARGPLFRTSLVELADDDAVLLVSIHHAIADGWSAGVLLDDLAALYTAGIQGTPAALPELAIQYADYARWQRQWLSGDALDVQLAYWKRRLGGRLPVLQIPAARRHPPMQTFRGASVDFTVSPALTAALHQLGQRHGSTLFMSLMAAFQVLLHRYSGQDDILVGTPMAGRTRSETETLIGLFLNTVVIRTDLAREPSFRDLLARVRDATLEAWAHQDLPFEKLVEELNPDRSLGHAPICQVMFVLQNTPAATRSFPGVALERFPLRDTSAKFDLTLSMEECGPAILGSLQYNVALFDAVTVERMVGHFLVLLEEIVREPGTSIERFALATDEERRALQRINATDTPYPHDRCLDQLFAAQVERRPDAMAVISGSQRLSYAALARRSCQLGHRLRRMGARPGTVIAVVMDKGWEQVVAMLGIHAAGSAYLPIDPGIPHDRLTYILDHAEVDVVVTQPWIDERLAWPGELRRVVIDHHALAGEDSSRPAAVHTPDDLAYVLYTSGSTGRPKGVALRHRGAVNTVCDINTRFAVSPDDRVIAMSAATFDLSVYDVFGTLAAGAAIVIPDARAMRDPAHWAELVRTERVSIWSSVPAYMQMLSSLLEARPDLALPSLRLVALSGDVLPLALPDRIRAVLGPIEIVNLGGNTEASIWSVIFPVEAVDRDWQSVPYGHPLANQRCYVLNRALVACPTSVPGDLYFAGVGLAREYWRDEARTRDAFLEHPGTGERIYRTGDLAYWRADGELNLLGRSDFQVKIQGFRIEPAEIELALKAHPGVRDAIAIARDDGRGQSDKRLVAYLVAREGALPPVPELRKFLAERLPDYMIPSIFMAVAELPLSANGKIDRQALPVPEPTIALAGDDFVAPRTPLEHTVAALWCQVLGVERVGIHDNFFDLGGHSLLATQLVSRLPAALGVELPLRTMFEFPTIAQMGVAVAQQLASHKDDVQLASLLSELEGLSDAEAEDRLARAASPEG